MTLSALFSRPVRLFLLGLLLAAPHAAFAAPHAAFAAPRVLMEWRFDRPDALRDWTTNADMASVVTGGEGVSFHTAGGDPILEYRPRFNLPATPWQVIEVRMKADRPGMVELFWSGTDQGAFGGFSQEKHTTFTARGGGAWRTYRMAPFWQKEGRIIRLRFDPYGGARFTLAWIRVVEQAPEPTGAAGLAGLRALNGATAVPAPGGIRLRAPDSQGLILFPQPSVDALARSVVAVRLRATGSPYRTLAYAGSGFYGLNEFRFAVEPDGREHLYNLDMLRAPGWAGSIVALGLRAPENPADRTTLGSIRMEAVAKGGPALKALWFGIEEALPRAGVPVTLAARLINTGGEIARGLRVAPSLPSGAQILRAEKASAVSLRFGQEEVWRWRVRFPRPMRARIGLRAQSANAPAFTARAEVHITPRLAPPPPGVLPPPEPVRGPLDVGIYYFPGWKTAASWSPIMRFPERRPVLGWYREGDPQVADWHVKWAVEHGITFFAYDWYWSQGSRSLEHALHEGLFRSRYGEKLRFCLLWANHNAENTSSYADLLAANRYWIENYFRRPNYYTINGRPVVIIFTPYRFRSDMGSAEVRRAFDAMKAACRAEGLKEVYLIACVGGDTSEAIVAAREGYDAITAYNWPGLGIPAAQLYAPFDPLTEAYGEMWKTLARTSPLPMMLPLSGGWDSRPWHGDSALVRYGRNPTNFARHLRAGRAFIAAHPGKTLPVALIEAWNELGEGSYVEPHQEFGFGYLDAIRQVFTNAPAAHRDYTPADIGWSPPQVEFGALTQSRWSFAKGMQGWSAMMGLSEPQIAGGALITRSTNGDPAFNSPPLELPADTLKTLHVEMRLTPAEGAPFEDEAQLFWSTRNAGTSEAASVRFQVRADGEWHAYRAALTANPRWRSVLTGLRFDPVNRTGVAIEIKTVELLP